MHGGQQLRDRRGRGCSPPLAKLPLFGVCEGQTPPPWRHEGWRLSRPRRRSGQRWQLLRRRLPARRMGTQTCTSVSRVMVADLHQSPSVKGAIMVQKVQQCGVRWMRSCCLADHRLQLQQQDVCIADLPESGRPTSSRETSSSSSSSSSSSESSSSESLSHASALASCSTAARSRAFAPAARLRPRAAEARPLLPQPLPPLLPPHLALPRPCKWRRRGSSSVPLRPPTRTAPRCGCVLPQRYVVERRTPHPAMSLGLRGLPHALPEVTAMALKSCRRAGSSGACTAQRPHSMGAVAGSSMGTSDTGSSILASGAVRHLAASAAGLARRAADGGAGVEGWRSTGGCWLAVNRRLRWSNQAAFQ